MADPRDPLVPTAVMVLAPWFLLPRPPVTLKPLQASHGRGSPQRAHCRFMQSSSGDSPAGPAPPGAPWSQAEGSKEPGCTPSSGSWHPHCTDIFQQKMPVDFKEQKGEQNVNYKEGTHVSMLGCVVDTFNQDFKSEVNPNMQHVNAPESAQVSTKMRYFLVEDEEPATQMRNLNYKHSETLKKIYMEESSYRDLEKQAPRTFGPCASVPSLV
ncbi:hypothetical protein MJG53_016016 [Ovis ammon polii x Ovis aries]|uniref:Uncharacterized protein n=1 Tax=Ovis ammon polii x Ovis aries TaxID=2918886 RepID=A0ACB9UCV1_9CETA|nr:hypothetical protein MJG53_016016 [Ovis ammon polii x Ovis aries]